MTRNGSILRSLGLTLTTLLAALAGCAPGGGLLIRPVNTNEKLKETTVATDDGILLRDKIVIIDVEGTLNNSRDRSIWASENPVALFSEKIRKAQRDKKVVGLIVRINSPGGGVTASEIMHQRLMAFRRKRPKVPVVAIIEAVGASGGYYVACATQEIWAHQTSVTGSIGVITPAISLAGTLSKIGVTTQLVTSGPFKAMNSPLKPLDQADIAILQGIVDEFYERFVTVVDTGRAKLTTAQVRKLADGRVYTGPGALKNGLVDRLGQMPDAIKRVKELAGKDAVKVVMYHRPHGYRGSYDAGATGRTPQVNIINLTGVNLLDMARPRFMYLWTGREGG